MSQIRRRLPQLVEAVRHKTGGLGFDSRWCPWKFSSSPNLLSAFRNPGVHSASNRNEYQGISLRGKLRPAHRTDSSAVLVVPNIKVKLEAQHFIRTLSFHEMLRESFTFTFTSPNIYSYFCFMESYFSQVVYDLFGGKCFSGSQSPMCHREAPGSLSGQFMCG